MAMKWEASAFKNPLARARGLGNGHGALHHWTMQRITAVFNLLLMAWAICSVLVLAGADYAFVQDWFRESLFNPVLMTLFVVSTFYHASLGLQVVIEDYVHCQCYKIVSLLAVRLGLFALAMVAIFSILKLAL